MTIPQHFCDQMIEGDFVSFKHDHYFETGVNGTVMRDIIQFESPYNFIGKIFNMLYLTRYLKKLIIKRNECIKFYAESGEWETILKKH